jgi:hypothetical protein
MKKLLFAVALFCVSAKGGITHDKIITIEVGTHCWVESQEQTVGEPVNAVFLRIEGDNEIYLELDGTAMNDMLFSLIMQYVDDPKGYQGKLHIVYEDELSENYLQAYCNPSEKFRAKRITAVYVGGI